MSKLFFVRSKKNYQIDKFFVNESKRKIFDNCVVVYRCYFLNVNSTTLICCLFYIKKIIRSRIVLSYKSKKNLTLFVVFLYITKKTNQKLKRIIETKFEKNSTQKYERNLLYYHFRNQKHIISKFVQIHILYIYINFNVFKNRLFVIVCEINFENIKSRTRDIQKHKKKYIVSNSNHI